MPKSLEEMNSDFFHEFMESGDLVFDVGASRGVWTEYFLSNKAGRVVAIEPQGALVKTLDSKFSGLPVSVIQCALSDKNGFATMYKCQFDTLATLSRSHTKQRFKDNKWSGVETVETRTLDSIIEQFGEPKFIKIDVEGHEPKVFEGVTTPIYSYCFEYVIERMDKLKQCMDLIDRFDVPYEYSYTTGDYPSFKCIWSSREVVLRNIYAIQNKDLWGNAYARIIKDK